ncbi:MAG: acyl-CoA dehydrogenase family protein [Deltaproteobacteria bacterium]|nr:acyl-CoA dehydrogenase family protein [Deltaproteobacteria bacterium]
MIEFELTEKQRFVQQGAHMVAQTIIRPISLQADREHKIPEELLRNLAQMGSSMSAMPREMGGDEEVDPAKDEKAKKPRQANRMGVLGAEEIAWGDAAVLMTLPGPGLGAPPVRANGTKEQQERFFAPFRDTTVLRWGAYGLTEPGAGSDVAGIRTTCRKDGDHYVLNGRKCYITNGGRAIWTVIFATIDPALGRAGHRAFVVEKGTPGFVCSKIEDKIGLRASETAELTLEECRVHRDNLLGGEARYEGTTKEGFMAAMKTFDSSRPMVGAMAIGIGRAAYEHARDFVKANYVLDRPIPRYRAIAEKLARCERRLAAARMLVWRAAWMADLGLANAKEASMAKAAGGQAAVQTCIDAIEICGAHGSIEDGEHAFLAKWFRDIKVFDIFEGTGQIQRIVISKRLYEGLKAF